jgi:hypothetical protein
MWRFLSTSVFLGLTIAAGCDGDVESSLGPPLPRLSASLTEDAPGTTTYTARVLVSDPTALEYLALSVSSGATIAFSGSPSSTTFCSRASEELAFAIASAPGAPTLTVVLGRWAGMPDVPEPVVSVDAATSDSGTSSRDASSLEPDATTASDGSGADAPAGADLGPTLGPSSACANLMQFDVEESLVVSIPGAATAPTEPADASATDASTADVTSPPDAESDSVTQNDDSGAAAPSLTEASIDAAGLSD